MAQETIFVVVKTDYDGADRLVRAFRSQELAERFVEKIGAWHDVAECELCDDLDASAPPNHTPR